MKTVDLTKGNVLKVLTALALPIMGGSLLQFSYNLIDMLWVGGLGADAVASVGSSSFYTGLGYAINAMVITGVGVKLSHAIGKGDEQGSRSYINSGLVLNGIIGLIYAVVLIVFGGAFISFLQIAEVNVQKDAQIYLMWSGPTLFFAFYNILFARILGSYGNNKEAFKINATGIIINIILDPILIYGFKMGVLGAGIATLIANIVMFVIYIWRGKKMFAFDRAIGVESDKVKEIVKMGRPIATQRVLFTLVNIILARFIGAFGADAIAAQKIGLQIESVTLMVIGGLNGAIASFTGQNFGAKKYSRIHQGYRTALVIGGLYALTMTTIFTLTPEPIVRLFIRETSAIEAASHYLMIIGAVQIFATIEMITNGLYTGLGIVKISARISIIFTVLRIPMALLLMPVLGINGIWLSIASSSVLKGIVAYTYYLVKVKRQYGEHREQLS